MKISRRLFSLALGASLAGTLSALPVTGMTADPVKVGILLPLSGSVAPIGQNNRRGHELAIEEINAAGGIKALGGAKLQMIDGDTQGKPEIGITELQKLERQGVVAVMGAYQSGVTFPVTQISEKLGVPFIDPVAIADSITSRGYKYLFKVAPQASWYARDQVRFIKDASEKAGKPVKTLVLMHEDTLFGKSTGDGQVKAAGEFGMKVLDRIAYPAATPDMTATIAKVKQLNPDAVLLVSYLSDAVLITKTMKELGVNAPIIGTSAGHIDPAYISTLGKDADLTFTVGEWATDVKKKGVTEIAKRFKDKFGIEMNGHAAETYMSTYVLADALERAGSKDRKKLRDALATTKLCGDKNILPYDCIRFDQTGQSPEAQLIVMQIQGGMHKTVWPFNAASAKLVWPVPAWEKR